jgi:hypothetical protein
MEVRVFLPKDRTLPGILLARDGDRELAFRCLGKSDNLAAVRAGNAARDPLKPFGDTPTGAYTAQLIPPGADAHSYGPNPRFLLTPVSGDAVSAARSGLELHGGAHGPDGILRPTEGCLRADDETLARLASLYRTPFSVFVTELS